MRTQLLGVGVGVGVGVGLKKNKTHVPEIDAMQQYFTVANWALEHWSDIKYYRHTYIDLKVSPVQLVSSHLMPCITSTERCYLLTVKHF